MTGPMTAKGGDAMIITAVRFGKQEFFEPYRLNLSKGDDYSNLWMKRTEIGLPNPKLVISLSGDTESFSVQPWYSSAFREALLQTVAEFGDCWILSSSSCKCVCKLVDDLVHSLKIRRFKTRALKIQPIVEQGLSTPIQSDDDKIFENRIKLEKFFSDQNVPMLKKFNLQMRVPLVVFIVEGGLQTLKHVTASLKNKIPVVVIEGSGKVADVIAECMTGKDLSRKVNEILISRAPNLLGYYFDTQTFNSMSSSLWEIISKRWLVQIFNIQELQPIEMSRVISELLMTAWSVDLVKDNILNLEDTKVAKAQPDTKEPPQLLKRNSVARKSISLGNSHVRPFSPVSRIREDNKKPLTRRASSLQKSRTPLPVLFSYLACQFLQDENKLETELIPGETSKITESQRLLFEALKGNDAQLVETLLGYNVRFNPESLTDLYKETLDKQNHLEADNCCRLYWIHESFNKAAADSLAKGSPNDDANTTRLHAISLFQSILNYGKLADMEVDTDMDLLLWSILTHRRDIAEIFWRRGKNQIVSALLGSAGLKHMAKNARLRKEIEFAEELKVSAKMLQKIAVDLIYELHRQDSNAVHDIIHADTPVTIWGITTEARSVAYYYNMMDFMSSTPVQLYLTDVWYGKLGQDWSHFFKGWTRNPYQALRAPLTKFQIHYIVYIVFLLAASYLVLTGVHPVERPYTWPFVSTMEWVLIIYVSADLFEEVYSNIADPSGGQSLGYRMKHWITDFWNLLDFLSYVFFLIMIVAQVLWDHKKATRRFFCLSLVVFYLRLLVMFIPWETIGVKVMLIKEMLKDLLQFLAILAVFVVGCGVSYHSLIYPNHSDLFHGRWEYWRIWRMVYLPYWQIYGEPFNEEIEGKIMPDGCHQNYTEWYDDPEHDRCPYEDWMAPMLSTAYVLICNLLLVNLVIATFSHTFQRVQENSQKIWRHYRYSLVQEHRDRIPPPFNIALRPLYWIIGIFKACGKKLSGNKVNEMKKPIEPDGLQDAIDINMFVQQGAEICLLARKREEWHLQRNSNGSQKKEKMSQLKISPGAVH